MERLDFSQLLSDVNSKEYPLADFRVGEFRYIPIGRGDMGQRFTIWWKGQKRLTNVPEEYFENYRERIETGELVVGPGVYVARGEIIFYKSCLGLYVTDKEVK